MKKMVLLLSLMIFVGVAQAHTGHQDHPSVHGMLMVGQSKIYLSHLPMFHSPHDYQVIIEAEINGEALNAYKTAHNDPTETVYTLVPETFVLPEMIQHPTPFSAKIFKGHFERGGTMIADNVTVTIKKTIYFKKFSPNAEAPTEANYILFGNSSEQFMAHLITQKPDFDQVLQVSVNAKICAVLVKENIAAVTIDELANSQPINTSGALAAEITTSTGVEKTSIDIGTSLYLEFGDLSF